MKACTRVYLTCTNRDRSQVFLPYTLTRASLQRLGGVATVLYLRKTTGTVCKRAIRTATKLVCYMYTLERTTKLARPKHGLDVEPNNSSNYKESNETTPLMV